MKYRVLKKKNTFNRAQYIADKIGVIERGIWVEYFKKHSKDLSKVLKKIQSQNCKSILKQDIRKIIIILVSIKDNVIGLYGN